MDAQLTTSEIKTFRDTLKDYDPALEALATLEEQGGKIEGSFDRLWVEKNGPLPQMPESKFLWQITLKQLRQEVCGDDSFRTKLQEYTKNSGSTSIPKNISHQNTNYLTRVSSRLERTPRCSFSIAKDMQKVNRTPDNFGRTNQDMSQLFSIRGCCVGSFAGDRRFGFVAGIEYKFLSHLGKNLFSFSWIYKKNTTPS